MLVVGDKWQAINAFMGAELRYFTDAQSHLMQKLGGRRCVHLELLSTYRFGWRIVDFINSVIMAKTPEFRKMSSAFHGAGRKVEYHRGNPWQRAQDVLSQVLQALKAKEVQPGDIFVLVRSVKFAEDLAAKEAKQSAVSVFANGLANAQIPLFFGSTKDEEVLAGKLVFSTFNASKGLERAWVIVFGVTAYQFDSPTCPELVSNHPRCQPLKPSTFLSDMITDRLHRPPPP